MWIRMSRTFAAPYVALSSAAARCLVKAEQLVNENSCIFKVSDGYQSTCFSSAIYTLTHIYERGFLCILKIFGRGANGRCHS